ncbi:MAG: tRNA preQ1(34) S-adenosylmethionine ribosyltransferase-isomerase QueA [Desulfobacterales bacterium]|nr:tRNA preQ1(34) S-adenosylmethionine ribosyltransferase-isomerase QueA [Desulfobacterales bacterium]
MFSLKSFNYDLPPDLIAQKPAERRDRSNLLCLNRRSGQCSHRNFFELGDFLARGDVLVVNDTEVVPGRLKGKKETGGKVEVLISNYNSGLKSAEDSSHFVCRCLIKASKYPAAGTWLHFAEDLKAKVLDTSNGAHTLKFYAKGDFKTILYRIGQVPLPPYIKRNYKQQAPCYDEICYQTVYANRKGAIAAPTAGLHFTEELLEKLRVKGIKIATLTLHVGFGTFLPVRAGDIRKHKMHAEPFAISENSAKIINSTRTEGGRVIAVGTTCVRTLESVANPNGEVRAGSGSCDLFIFPGYRFKTVDALITNFHLPQSTLLMLVSAFAGRRNVLNAYHEAVHRKYRFYSYGDAMYIC